MSHLKKSWKKERSRSDIPDEVMEHIAARGSFVVVRSRKLFYDTDEEKSSIQKDKPVIGSETFTDILNRKILEVNFSIWMENLARNIQSIFQQGNISALRHNAGKSAIIVGAGPSFHENNHIELLKKLKSDNIELISTDRMFIPLLLEGIVPDYVISVDGHREKILPFYESDLIREGIATRAIMAVTVASNVVQKFPGSIYYFTPMIDDIENPYCLSAAMSAMTKSPILSTGGNVGVTGIFLAYYLGYSTIILTGMDMGYTRNTPIEVSQYYPVIKEADPTMTPEKYREIYVIEGFNPDFSMEYYTDITWKSHIDHVVEQSEYLAADNVTIINATEGGSIHGGRIRGMKLAEAIERYA